MMAQLEIDQFEQVNYPRDILRMHLISYDVGLGVLQIGFPSWGNKDKVNITTYDINNRKKDDCLCPGHNTYKLFCWHLMFRPVILKAFLNRKEGDDQSWMVHLETHRKTVKGKIIEYWMSLYYQQEIVSQKDILDLELQDHFGRNIDRRVIGSAVRTMRDAKMIREVYRAPAQYATRKGGMVGHYKKVV